MKIEINSRRKLENVKLNNTILNNNGSKKKLQENLENTVRQMIMKTQHNKTYGMQ